MFDLRIINLRLKSAARNRLVASNLIRLYTDQWLASQKEFVELSCLKVELEDANKNEVE